MSLDVSDLHPLFFLFPGFLLTATAANRMLGAMDPLSGTLLSSSGTYWDTINVGEKGR